ncbi:centromere-associated protein E isoform X3 [Vombatus ursinus]|uniref:centromere-associated protein E isoform X3 n=1 Tax=Vombatus ursinus TaxID=29139 RepID=UPI000FFD19BE|nr:centromere-associated protein E isoform X3 [Vombatus ursinus]
MADEGAVTVCVRVRPLISREQDLGDAAQLHWKTEDRLISQIDGTRSFSFDRVFHSNETTEKVYEEIAVPIIRSAIQGYNGTIFAYGQTASGKTYTMMGSADGLGVIPKAINDIFIKIKEIPEREFLLRVSYMEIYNETITDLLCDTRKMKPLEIREDFNRNVYVADLTEEVVSTPDLALQWIKKGERNRHYGKTKMNQRSSRSHTIFRMILESREKGDPSNCDGAVMVSHLNLVDLAGSERASQTGSEGVRLKEGCNINRSLFILGQVIKKLSDGQAGGFINYRDSKLTRILQNSLGGNAKTLIICTITPVSFDETLSTLQFASTAKYMKNTPHVNEVLDDEALLKRYRKEIIDLKKQLEEVSSETRVQAMEKDQLAQLLEEKDLLQKVQNDKIHNLTQMLVTSSSVTLQQDLKAKRKRRVTWCPGKTNKMKDIGYMDDFDTTKVIVAKSVKAPIPSIVETDESICSEFDIFSNTLETISEMEWNPATKLNQIQEQDLLDSVELCETIISEKETMQNELNSLRANFDNLVLDYEQLQRKKTEMELKLNEKLELDEFVTLEVQTIKEQENELNLKSRLLKEKEEQIIELQKLLELQRVENMKMGFSTSVENGEKLHEELKHLKQSLHDTETIALDAKKEAAFLRSENKDLKEKMEELSSRCKQLEKENHQYQSQLEERKDSSKRRQADLERELQSAFNEITQLTSIINGKYPKDLLLAVELERKVKDLQKDLDKEIEENAALQKEINILSELKSLPTEVEILRKERVEKSEELDLIMAEKDKLLTEVVYKDNRIQELLDEIEKTKEELAASQSNHETTTQEYQDFKRYHGELEQNYFTMLEEMEKMKHQIITISEEAHEVVLDLDDLVSEPHVKAIKLNEGQNLEAPRNLVSLTDYEKDNELLQQQRQISSLIQENNQLQQMLEFVTAEKNQLKTDLEENIEMTIENQEELRNIGAALKQQQEAVIKERRKTAEKEGELLMTQERLADTEEKLNEKIQELEEKEEQILNVRKEVIEAQEKMKEIEQLKNQLKSTNSTLERVEMENLELAQRLQGSLEETTSVTKEINELKRTQVALQLEKDQLKENIREVVTKGLETQEELKIAQLHLREHQETMDKLKECFSEQAAQGLNDQEDLEKTNAELQEKIQELQAKQEQILNVREEFNEAQEKMKEIEQLKEQLISKDSALERVEMEKLELAQKLQASLEETTSVTEERDELTKTQEALHVQRDQLKETIRDLIAKDLETQEKLKVAQMDLKEHQDTLDKLTECISEKEALEKTSAELQEKIQELEAKQKQIFNVREEVSEAKEKMKEMEQLKEQLKSKDTTLERREMENLELAQKLQASLEETTSVTEERDELTKTQEALHRERDQLKETIRDLIAKGLDTQEELKIAQMDLKEHQEIIDKLKECVSEKTAQVSETQEAFEKINAELQKKIQELQEQKEQVCSIRKEVTEAQEKVKEVERLKEQLKSKDSALERREMENLELAQKLQASLEETTSVTEERDELTKTQEALHVERDQLKETIRDLIAKNQETQEELKFAEMCLKEHQETIDKLKECISEKTAQVSKSQEALERTNAERQEKILKLQETEEMLLSVRKEVNEMKLQRQSLSQMAEQLKHMTHTLSVVEAEKLDLTQKLDSSLSKMNTVIKERDALKETEKILQMEVNHLKESLRKIGALNQQKPKELVNIEANTREDIRQHPIENLKEKYLKINELLKKYTMIENRCGFLSRLSLDLKRAFESQNQLQVKVQACLSHTPQETKAVGKLLASNRRCNNDLHSSSTCILKKLEGVLKRVIDIRREHHNTIYKIEMDLIEETEKQNDLFIKIQHLQQHSEIGSQELSGYKKLSQKMHLHIEQILKDVSETQNDINNMVAEFQQLLNAKKEIILSLEMCLSTHLDVESLKIIQEENDRIVHVNNLYHSKIKAIMNKSSEFEDRSVVVCKEWELELRQMKDKNEEMVKKFQTIKTTLLPLDDPDALTVRENKQHHLKLRRMRQTTEEIQETAFHEDKENKHEQKEIDQMQKNLEVAKVVSNKHLQSQQPAVQSCQDVKAVFSKEIDDLKMKLVKLNMEKMNEAKKFEKEIASKAAIIEHQEEIISQLKENLRRAQQSNDVSMVEPPGHAQASHTPLTCGGGSGIVQSTKALILKADRVRLEREISKLKQQNEYLTNHQSQLSSNNFHLAREVKKWKERALKKEAQELTRVHSPKSPKLTEITSLKRQCMSPLYKEQASQETLPKDSPKSWAYDGRSKSLPVACHNNFFDNSGLGLLPEIAFSSTNDSTKETPGEENTGSLLDQWQTSSGKDAPECRTQ